MYNIDEDAADEFNACIEMLAKGERIDLPKDHLGAILPNFIKSNYRAILKREKTLNATSSYVEVMLRISQEHPAFRPSFRNHPELNEEARRQAVYQIGRGDGSDADCNRIMFWMLSRFPDYEETEALERRVFRGSDFKEFFGFPLPQEGEQAKQLYNEWMSQNLIKDGSLHVNEGTEQTVQARGSNDTQSDTDATSGISEISDLPLAPTQEFFVAKAFRWKWYIAGVAFTMVIVVALLEPSRMYLNAVKRTILPTISLSSETFQIDSFYLDGQKPTRSNWLTSFSPAHAEGVLLLGASDIRARDLLSSTQTAGFHKFELISENVRTTPMAEWPFEPLAAGRELVYGRSLGAAEASDRFQVARHLQTLQLDCFSGSFSSALLSHYSVSQSDCQRLEIEYRNFHDLEFGFIDFSPILTDTFGYDIPDINKVGIEVDEVRSGTLSALSVSSGNPEDFVLIARNYWGANTGWGTLFAGRSASAVEIGTEDTGLSVLVHALDTNSDGSLFLLLDHATGAIRTRLKTTEPVHFFNIEYGTGRRDAQLTIATDGYIFEIGMQLYRDGITF